VEDPGESYSSIVVKTVLPHPHRTEFKSLPEGSASVGLDQREVRTRELTRTDHLPGLADDRLKVQWRWKLRRLCRTAGLCSELPSFDMRCTQAVEEKDYDVMYSIDGIH
jgi:hypothetical protein